MVHDILEKNEMLAPAGFSEMGRYQVAYPLARPFADSLPVCLFALNVWIFVCMNEVVEERYQVVWLGSTPLFATPVTNLDITVNVFRASPPLEFPISQLSFDKVFRLDA